MVINSRGGVSRTRRRRSRHKARPQTDRRGQKHKTLENFNVSLLSNLHSHNPGYDAPDVFSARPGLAQNAPVFPDAVAGHSDLFIVNNGPASALSSSLSSSGTGYSAPSPVSIDDEIMAVCRISGTTLTFGRSACPHIDRRGLDQTTAVSHVSGKHILWRCCVPAEHAHGLPRMVFRLRSGGQNQYGQFHVRG
jgi:hypothetical protein